MNNTTAVERASITAIGKGMAVSVDVSAGMAIRCVTGKVWLTQEGDLRDHVVPAGMTFCTDRAGRVVLSAVDGAGEVIVCKAPAYCAPGSVVIDSIERFTQQAKAEQAAYMAGLFARLLERIAGAIRRGRGATPAARSGGAFRGYVRSL